MHACIHVYTYFYASPKWNGKCMKAETSPIVFTLISLVYRT